MAPTRKDTEATIASLLAEAELPSGPAAVRNINVDVHAGGFAQRPYARLEDDLARAAGGQAVRFEDLPPEAHAVKDPVTGEWRREIRVHTGEQRLKDGVLYNVVRPQLRPIAATLEDAKARQADFWAGSTWIRRGVKPEADHPVNQGLAAQFGEEILEPVSATEQIQARQDALNRIAGTPVIPAADPSMKVEGTKADPDADASPPPDGKGKGE